jgi:hypothetical protein
VRRNSPHSPYLVNMKRLVILLLVWWCAQPTFAQRERVTSRRFFVTAGFNLGGAGFSPNFSQQLEGSARYRRTTNFAVGNVTDVNGNASFAIIANTTIGVHSGFIVRDKNKKGFTGIEFEFQQNKACYSFNNPFVYSFQGDSSVKWVMTDKYLRAGVTLQRTFFMSDVSAMGGEQHIYARLSYAHTFYNRNFNVRIVQDHFEDWTENGRGMTAKTIEANIGKGMISAEVGLKQFAPDKDRAIDIGVVVHVPLAPTYVDQYTFYQANAVVGKQNVTYHGSSLMLNFRYNFQGAVKVKVPDTTKPAPAIVQTVDTTERKMDVQLTYKTTHRKIKIIVYDRNEVDGDKISLYHNGKLVASNVVLKRRKKRFKVKLEPGSNYILMYAENLGDIPPNTAAVVIKSGRKKKNVTISSDESKSGAIELIYLK